jgi:hypothetical protein
MVHRTIFAINAIFYKHYQSYMEYHYPMIKVEWLAAGVGFVNGQLRWRRNCTFRVLHGNQRPTELTNKMEIIMTKHTQIIYSSGASFACTEEMFLKNVLNSSI